MNIRIGQGIDVHAFGPGDHVMLGGVRMPHERGVVAHSDGDVVHPCAVRCDARRAGAGRHRPSFPAVRPALEGCRQPRLPAPLQRAARASAAGRVGNADVTVICERPEGRAARRRDARATSPTIWASRSTRSASRRPPARSSASPAAAKASPRRRSCCWCAASSVSAGLPQAHSARRCCQRADPHARPRISASRRSMASRPAAKASTCC